MPTGSGSGTGTRATAPTEPAVPLYTVNELIEDALKEIGVLEPGETAQIEDVTDAMRQLNRMIDQWRTERLLVYRQSIDRYTLTADQAAHTIGPGGDFEADRPVKVVRANIVITDVSPETHEPLILIERAEEWAAVRIRSVSSALPQYLFYHATHPDGTLYLWPYPSAAYDLELTSWLQLDGFAELTDEVNLPPGYEQALMLSLAERLCPSQEVPLSTREMVAQDAALARYKIKSLNQTAPRINLIDSGMPVTAGE